VSSFGVVLDACVLIPAALRDTLLRAAEYRLYRVFWSEAILDEVRRNLVADHLTDPPGAARLVAQLRRAFPGSPVEGYGPLLPLMPNDPKDRHVLAAAVKAGAQVVVTRNLADFPAAALEPFGVEAQSPDEFLVHLFDLAPRLMARIVVEQTADKRRQPALIRDTLNALAVEAPAFVQRVRQLSGAILTQHPDDPAGQAIALGFFRSAELAKMAAELSWSDDQAQRVARDRWGWQQDGPLGPRWEARLPSYRYTIVEIPLS